MATFQCRPYLAHLNIFFACIRGRVRILTSIDKHKKEGRNLIFLQCLFSCKYNNSWYDKVNFKLAWKKITFWKFICPQLPQNESKRLKGYLYTSCILHSLARILSKSRYLAFFQFSFAWTLKKEEAKGSYARVHFTYPLNNCS